MLRNGGYGVPLLTRSPDVLPQGKNTINIMTLQATLLGEVRNEPISPDKTTTGKRRTDGGHPHSRGGEEDAPGLTNVIEVKDIGIT